MKNKTLQEIQSFQHYTNLKRKEIIKKAFQEHDISEISNSELADLKNLIDYLKSDTPASQDEITEMLVNFYDCLIMTDKDKPKENMFCIYLEMLKDLTVSEVSMIRRNVLLNNKFFPTIAEIVKIREGANEYASTVRHKVEKTIWNVLKIDVTEYKYYEKAQKNEK